VAVAALATTSAFATNGYFSHGYGIKAQGMGGASVAMAQDAFSGANNPASSVFSPSGYEVGVSLFSPHRSMSRTGVTGGYASYLNMSQDSDKEAFLIPELGYNTKIDDKSSWGVAIYGNGGMNTTYKTNPFMGTGDGGVNLEQLIIAPTYSLKINDNSSVGVSPLIVHQRFKAYGLQAFDNMSGMPAMTGAPGYVTNNGTDTSNGLGVRVGYLNQMSNGASFGVAYAPKVNMSKFSKYKGLFAEQGDFDIPANFSVGVAVPVAKNLMLAVDYQKIYYSKVAAISNPSSNQAAMGADNGPGFGWKDISVLKFGVQFAYSNDLTLRAGYNRGQNPISANDVSFNILAPGVVTDHLTLGFTKKIDTVSELSGMFMYARTNSISGMSMFNGPAFSAMNLGGPIAETISMNQRSIGLQYSRRF
jgi:long-chain fatty acid transport protein